MVLALLAAVDPIRIGIAVLLFSRPRPILNVLAFWIGGLAMACGLGVVVLVVLRGYALTVLRDMSDIAATAPARYLQLALGILALLTAARLALRLRRTGPPSTATRIGRSLGGGSLWVAFAAGLGMATPWEYLAVLAAILASGAAAGAQLGAVLLFIVMAFAIVEVPLVSYVAAPSRTREVILRVQIWSEQHRRHVVIAIVAVLGGLLVTTALGGT
ncbi:Protein of uncharacterised function (DUF2910) [Mycobacteroides abscessus subsp. bolletii]|nr:Protein of uncharacterised function (DUF2910) [Mycobacteroides abscessus subsp. bolletii]